MSKFLMLFCGLFIFTACACIKEAENAINYSSCDGFTDIDTNEFIQRYHGYDLNSPYPVSKVHWIGNIEVDEEQSIIGQRFTFNFDENSLTSESVDFSLKLHYDEHGQRPKLYVRDDDYLRYKNEYATDVKGNIILDPKNLHLTGTFTTDTYSGGFRASPKE